VTNQKEDEKIQEKTQKRKDETNQKVIKQETRGCLTGGQGFRWWVVFLFLKFLF